MTTLSINGHAVIPGAEWMTRDNDTATIGAIDETADHDSVIIGWIEGNEASWCENGRFYEDKKHGNDLIRPVAAPAEKKVEKPLNVAGGILTFLETLVDFCNQAATSDKHSIGTLQCAMKNIQDDAKAMLKAITPAPEKRKVQIAEFWTLHGSIDGTVIAAFMHKPALYNRIIIHHPAREIEVDDV